MNVSLMERCDDLFAAINDLQDIGAGVESGSDLDEAITWTIHDACELLMDVGYLERQEVPED